MVVQKARWILTLAAMVTLGQPLTAAVPTVEDLTGCKLSNGRAVLTAVGASTATSGGLYKFSTNQFSDVPTNGGAPLAPDDLFARLSASKAADLQYLPAKGGSLWAFSGAITEVPGVLYLSDASGKKLDEPWPLPKTSRNQPGECTPIHEGGIYLLKTTDGKFVLFRLLDKSDTAAVIQYVYQDNGSTVFTIPLNAPVAYQRPVDAQPTTAPAPAAVTSTAPTTAAGPVPMPTTQPAPVPSPSAARAPVILGSAPVPATLAAMPSPALSATTPPTLGPGDVNEHGVIRLVSGAQSTGTTSLEPTIDTFALQRTQMLQRRVNIIYAPARTPEEIDRKAQAITELVALRPDEPQVLDMLVDQISFFNPRSANRDVSPDALHPCFAALKHMGKPATSACLKAMRELDLDAPGEGIDSAMYKAKLLGMVVRSIEGNDVAEFIFHQQADQESDPKRRAVFELLLAK